MISLPLMWSETLLVSLGVINAGQVFVILVLISAVIIAAGFYFLKKIFNRDFIDLLKFTHLYEKQKSRKAQFALYSEDNTDTHKGSHIYESKNGTPEQNMAKILEMLGGIETLIGKDDIVIIKPNAQKIRHNMTNTNTILEFINQVLSIPGFAGEVIIAENNHCHPSNAAGWTTEYKNGDYNLNELIAYYNDRGIKNVTKYHWRDAGTVPNFAIEDCEQGRIVSEPQEGDGYVWSDEEYSYHGCKTKMTYPIFTSSYSGVTIDFKNGAWKNGKYTQQPVKFINMSALRHHSNAGVTATVKNYLGVVDLTCGYHGLEPAGYYNFHYIAVDWPLVGILRKAMKSFITSKFAKKRKITRKVAGFVGPQNGAMGGAVGHFIKTIRKADLNIITAEYAGHRGRHIQPGHTKTVLASTDPVALDYYAGKYVLYPLGGPRAGFNNPDNPRGTFRKYLELCCAEGIGTLNEAEMIIHKFDFGNK
jgi:hypothetical protein